MLGRIQARVEGEEGVCPARLARLSFQQGGAAAATAPRAHSIPEPHDATCRPNPMPPKPTAAQAHLVISDPALAHLRQLVVAGSRLLRSRQRGAGGKEDVAP